MKYKIFIKGLLLSIGLLVISVIIVQLKPRDCSLLDKISGANLGDYTQSKIGDSLLIEVKGGLDINRFLIKNGNIYTSNGVVDYWLYSPKTHIITVRDKFSDNVKTWEVVCK